MDSNIKYLVNKNIKFIIAMVLVILLGIFGITYAVRVAPFSLIDVDIDAATIATNISYSSGTSSTVISSGKMLPISDDLVTGPNITDERVLKASFNVYGDGSNPSQTIYDVALHDLEVDCELRTTDLKWQLYKNGALLSSGNLSPSFDTMTNNRLVLTTIQQDMPTSSAEADSYVFLLWISESCNGDITTCTKEQNQSKYLNHSFSGVLKVETSTKKKKSLVRNTASEGSCSYETIVVPIVNDSLTYNGTSQKLVNTGEYYTLTNDYGINAGEYVTTVKLNSGYKWTDGTTDDKFIKSTINRKNVTITASNQSINYGSLISNTLSDYTVSGLVQGHSLDSIFLDTSIADVGTGKITPTKVVIIDSTQNDVTNNYNLIYEFGDLTINCLNTASEPTVASFNYDGNNHIGVTGGNNIEIKGNTEAKESGTYNVTATPKKNYCWNDGTTTSKTYTWSINAFTIPIPNSPMNKTYNGNEQQSDITVPEGASIVSTESTTSAIDAGTYNVIFRLNDKTNTTWSDGTTTDKTVSWTIAKANMNISATLPSNITYGETSSILYTVNLSGIGNVTCNSSDPAIATCSVESGYIIITTVSSGNTDITVTASGDDNYNSKSISQNLSVNSKTVKGTFYYYNYNSISDKIVKTTSTCYITSGTTCTLSLPNKLRGMVGPSGSSDYAGVATSINSMTNASLEVSSDTTFYSFYSEPVTNYYYNNGSYGTRTIYRNEWFSSNTTMADAVLATTATGMTNYTTAGGPGNSTWAGLSITATTTVNYSSVSDAARSQAPSLYTIYNFDVTFAKGSNVSSIGTTSGSCKVTTSNTSCTISGPSITPNTGYTSVGWSTTNGAASGTAAGSDITISSNNQTWYANAADKTSPSNLSITSTSDKATSQTATLQCSDTVGVTGYYWGETAPTNSSTFTSITSTTNMSIDKTVDSTGTYYLACKDAAGNITGVSTKTSKAFYSVTTNEMLLYDDKDHGANAGYNTTNYGIKSSVTYIVPGGTSIDIKDYSTMPVVNLYTIGGDTILSSETDDFGEYGIYYNGYSTGSSQTSLSDTSTVTVNDNKTYYYWYDKYDYFAFAGGGMYYYNSDSNVFLDYNFTIYLQRNVNLYNGIDSLSQSDNELYLNGYIMTIPYIQIPEGKTLDIYSNDGTSDHYYSDSSLDDGVGSIYCRQSSSVSNTAYLFKVMGDLNIHGGRYRSNSIRSLIYVDVNGRLDLDDNDNRISLWAGNGTGSGEDGIGIYPFSNTYDSHSFDSVTKNNNITGVYGILTNSNANFEMVIRSYNKGIYIFSQDVGIRHAGVLRVMSTYSSDNIYGTELNIIGSNGSAISKITGNTQIGNDYCQTYDSCTSSETDKYGHYGVGAEQYPLLVTLSHAEKKVPYPVITSESFQVWFFSGVLGLLDFRQSDCTDLTSSSPVTNGSNTCQNYYISSSNGLRKKTNMSAIKFSTSTSDTDNIISLSTVYGPNNVNNYMGSKAMVYK